MQHTKTSMKKNERNAGRKKVKDGQRVILTVPKDKVKELKDFAKTIITYEKKINL